MQTVTKLSARQRSLRLSTWNSMPLVEGVLGAEYCMYALIRLCVKFGEKHFQRDRISSFQ